MHAQKNLLLRIATYASSLLHTILLISALTLVGSPIVNDRSEGRMGQNEL
jgi:hypothetical protein